MSEKPAAPWPLPGWEAVQPFPFAEARGAFAGMTGTEGRIVLKYYKRHDGSLVATARFGELSEGAPGLVHGGAILTALDEALGAAAWLAGRPVMTARLTTVLLNRGDGWQLLHMHTSVGVPDDEVEALQARWSQ